MWEDFDTLPTTVSTALDDNKLASLEVMSKTVYYDDAAMNDQQVGTHIYPCANVACLIRELEISGKNTAVYIKAGANLVITSDFIASEGQHFVGAGVPFTTKEAGKTVIFPKSNQASTITITDSVKHAGIVLGNDGHIEGITIVNPTSKHSIDVYNVNNSYIHDNVFNIKRAGEISYNQAAIHIKADKMNITGHRIEHNHITGNRKELGILIDNQDTSEVMIDTIKGNTITELLDGIYVNAARSASVGIKTISDNNFNGFDYASIETYRGKTMITTLSGNTFRDSHYGAVLSYQVVNGIPKTATISNNIFDSNAYGLDFNESLNRMTISGNTFNNSSMGFGFRITYGESVITFTGNTVTNNAKHGITVEANGSPGTLNIMDNVISGNTPKGIRVSSFNTLNVGLGNGITLEANPAITNTHNMGSNTGTNTVNLGH